jgi:dTDP-3-amino-3,4,6-trideoxy-alpha-D-glucose transaminase
MGTEQPRAGAQIPYVDLGAVHAEIGSELDAAVSRVSRSGWYLLGPELEAFEREFAAYCGVAHCVGVGSGMSAIELALRAIGVGPGDDVLVPAYTWVATWLAVSAVGARPVPVDVEESTYNIDVDAARATVTERTAAIVPVHLRGEPADMGAIEELARAHGLAVIEDSAQAHGARYRGRRAGALGRAAAFSFYPAKNLGAFGDGGAVTTDDADLAAEVRLLRNYGMRTRYEVEVAGVNSRLAELQAAVLRVKLGHLDAWNRTRRSLAGSYAEALAGLEGLELPEARDDTEAVWHLFVAGHSRRDACREALAAAGIETLIHYPVLPHVSGAYRDAGIPPGSLPVAERLAARAFSLPLQPQMDPAVVGRVAEALRAVIGSQRPESGR